MSCTRTLLSPAVYKRARLLCGTRVTIELHDDAHMAQHQTQAAFAEAERLQLIFQKLHAGSEFEYLLDKARKFAAYSQGAFRIFEREGAPDLRGLAKGFIADRMADILGANHPGVINAGGDLRFLTEGPHSAFIRTHAGLRSITTSAKALATSALSEALRNKDSSTRYPLPLRPGLSEWHTVTALADNAMTADALTKVALFGQEDVIADCTRAFNAHILIFAGDGSLAQEFAAA